MKVLLVSGSPRKNGNTDSLLKVMAEKLEDSGLKTFTAHLRDYDIHACIGCEQCRKDKTCTRFLDGMHLLYPEIESSVGLVLASPTYNYNLTPMMKAFIDRLYPYFDFTEPRPGPYTCRLAGAGRKATCLGVCEQLEEKELGVTLRALCDPLPPLGYEVLTEVTITGHFLRGSVKKDELALEKAEEAAEILARGLKKLA
jgi:multimeric flavodoxin WrbA